MRTHPTPDPNTRGGEEEEEEEEGEGGDDWGWSRAGCAPSLPTAVVRAFTVATREGKSEGRAATTDAVIAPGTPIPPPLDQFVPPINPWSPSPPPPAATLAHTEARSLNHPRVLG